MSPPCPRMVLALALLLVFAGFAEAARYQTPGPGTQPGSGVDIEVHTLFQRTPMRGFAPVRFTISNTSGSAHTWRVVFTSNLHSTRYSLTHEAVLTVADGEAKRFDIMVPLIRIDQYGGAPTARVYGHGIDPNDRQLIFPMPPSRQNSGIPPAMAMSPSLWMTNGAGLENHRGSRMNGSAFDPALMPTDWRAYAGLESLWLTDQEWLSTGAAERAAVLEWVAIRGLLYICRESDDSFSLPGIGSIGSTQPVTHGFGVIRSWPRTGSALAVERTADQILSGRSTIHNNLRNTYHRRNWALLEKLPELKVRPVLFIGFLLFFGILVGPVNLLFFARGSRRYRLFWTTPALSGGASVAMILLILLQDGVGGTGHQLSVWHHLPGENKAIFLQEQASRTGLLTSREFPVDLPVSISPISISSIGSTGPGRMQANPRSYSGDWFQSRSIQGQLIEGVSATRWRIEAATPLRPGTAPQLLSTFPFTLDSVFYRDAEGFLWHAPALQTGQSAQLEAVGDDALDEVWTAFLREAGPVIEDRLRGLAGSPERFFAFSDNNSESFTTTLKAIDWQTKKSLHTGPLARSSP